jgi:copper chaperone CopZ
MGDELTEFVDVEIFLHGTIAPADQQEVVRALEQFSGIAMLQIMPSRVDVRYDPISVTKHEIVQRLEMAGFRIKKVEAAASSPMTDSSLSSHESAERKAPDDVPD